MQGVLVQGLLERCQLSAVSEGLMSSGATYTYLKDELRTTIDYILMDLDVASMMICQKHPWKHPMVDLNTSDHLVIPVTLSHCLSSGKHVGTHGSDLKKVNWLEGKKCDALEVYEREACSELAPFVNSVYSIVEEMTYQCHIY